MIIKEPDERGTQIAQLEKLLPQADAAKKKMIELEIKKIRAGIKGEGEAAYEMRVHLAESKNWMVIHDLRLDVDGLIVQIDHLLINRLLDFLVCESKNFSEGVAINEHGEFTAFFHGKPYGVPSPIEQNNRHILLLKRLLSSGAVDMPKRLGFSLPPSLKSYVLVSKGARITRPKIGIPGLDAVIKNDQLFKAIDLNSDKTSALSIAKVISSETLEALARQIIALHQPASFDFGSKFGLRTGISPINPIPSKNLPEAVEQKAAVDVMLRAPEACQAKPGEEGSDGRKPKLVCHACASAVTYAVGKFCWMNKAKFGGDVYCMGCQKKV